MRKVRGTAYEPVRDMPLEPRAGRGRRKHDTDLDGKAIAAATRADILAAAEAEFASHGFDAANIDEIARRTQSSKRMIYYHFGNKRDLYREVLKQAYISLREHSIFDGIAEMEPMAGIRAYAISTFDSHIMHPNLIRLSAYENISKGTTLDALRDDLRDYPSTMEPLHELLDRGVSEGIFRPGLRVMDIYLMIVGMSFHTVSNQHSIEAIFGHNMLADDEVRARRVMLADMVCRYVANTLYIPC